MPAKNNKIKSEYAWYYPIIIILVIAIGIASTVYVYFSVDSTTKISLLQRTGTIASSLDPNSLENLSGSDADLASPGYIALKKKMTDIRSVNQDISFVYLTGIRDGEVFFFADSEDPLSSSYSPPGEVYFEATPTFKNVFVVGKSVIDDASPDRWGAWLTALSPIIGPDGKVVAVVGMDVNADKYIKSVVIYSAFPAIIATSLMILIAIGFLIKRREEQILQLKSELVSIASHEIRSPLTGVKWALESLLSPDNNNLSSDQRSTISLIKQNCEDLLGTVNDLLDISALGSSRQSLKPGQSVDIKPLLEEAVNSMHLTSRSKNINIELTEFPEGPINVFGDAKLKRVFGNIISNSIKYSQPGGKVIVKFEKQNSSYVISFKDNGIGVPLKDQPNIFKGFYRASNAKRTPESGTGLGLHYAKKIVEMSEGDISFKSEEGQGTTFFVKLIAK
ncbi:MAG: ATP-binding protein [Candidatus Paceibacterota bacterium]|jgi:signal transduction histidine kinase